MRRRLLLGYQLLTGLSDTGTGLLLIFVPALTLHLMKLEARSQTLPFVSYIGVFVLSTGLACLYGGVLARPSNDFGLNTTKVARLEVVWLLTALTRGLVALFVLVEVVSGSLEQGWVTVAVTDGLFAVIQVFGLTRGWLRHVES